MERLLFALIWHRAKRVTLHGYLVGIDATDPKEAATAEATLRAGFDLIAATWPRLLPRVRPYVRRVIANPAILSTAQWNRSLHQVELRLADLIDYEASPELIAVILVHELTHARLSARGISSRSHGRRRVEHTCIAQQLAFARCLPPGPAAKQVVAGSVRQYESVDELWSDTQIAARMRERAIAVGLPAGLVDILLRVRAVLAWLQPNYRMKRDGLGRRFSQG
jgi:hypothetical protein